MSPASVGSLSGSCAWRPLTRSRFTWSDKSSLHSVRQKAFQAIGRAPGEGAQELAPDSTGSRAYPQDRGPYPLREQHTPRIFELSCENRNQKRPPPTIGRL